MRPRPTQVTDAGCATLVAALDSGALPALAALLVYSPLSSTSGTAVTCVGAVGGLSAAVGGSQAAVGTTATRLPPTFHSFRSQDFAVRVVCVCV